MKEQQAQDHGAEAGGTSNVVPFEPVRSSRLEPPPSDDELAEYRRIRPQLMEMLEQWPKFLREHQAITSNCVIARKIMAGDP